MARAISPNSSFSIPVTQNTAPVLEFRCLFSTDIRRKQKRWQDGRLKFHAFNKRVRVFDERGGNIGDTHFQGTYEFEEGEELELDNGGTLVQVGECVARGVQDLTELIDKRIQAKEKRREAMAAVVVSDGTPSKTPAQSGGPLSFSGVTPTMASFQARPKSLNQLLGTPTGHHGRSALPTRSPFEERRSNAEKENLDERPAKRRKPEPAPSRSGYAQNLMGATLTLSKPQSTPTISRPIIEHPYPTRIDLTHDETPFIDASTQVISHASLESSGIRVTKAQRKDRVIEKSKPEKSGYAENLTGVALTLSNTFGKPRKTLPERQHTNCDIPQAPKQQSLHRSVRQEAIDPPSPRRVNPFLRDDDGFVGSIDAPPIVSSRSAKLPEASRNDDDLVEIERIVARPKKANTASEKKSQKASTKRQKISELKSKSSATTQAHHPPLVEAPEPSNFTRQSDDASKPAEENDVGAEKRLRPLRIRARPPRKMLISAGHSNSRSSANIARTRSITEDSVQSAPNLPDVPTNIDSVPVEEASEEKNINRQKLTSSVFDDDPHMGIFESHDGNVTKELLENQHHQSHTQKPSLPENPEPVMLQPVMRNEPSSSPVFEGVDYQTIDALLSKHGNASPFAPKALRQAISQSKSPLAPSRKNDRSHNSHLDPNSPTVSPRRPKQSTPLKESPSNTVTLSAFSREPVGTKGVQHNFLQSENSMLPEKPNHEKDQISRQRTDHISPKVKESSSALADPQTSIAPEPIPQNLKEPQPTANLPLDMPITTNQETTPDLNTSIPQILPAINETAQQINLNLNSVPKKRTIPNPATRGKKAAQKADAAGKAPILGPIFPYPPADPIMAPPPAPRPRMTRPQVRVRSAGSAGDASDIELAVEEEKGPWCKEAFDLFEWRPPGMRGEEVGVIDT